MKREFFSDGTRTGARLCRLLLCCAAVSPALGACAAARVDAAYLPERLDDFCWENPFCGMRAYGPALARPRPEGQGLSTSGIDVFNKGVGEPVLVETIRRALRERRSYHTPNGRCFDAYTVGPGCGCGGIARRGADGVWRPGGNWKAQRVLEKTSERAVFELVYDAYVLRGTVTADSPFVRFDATATAQTESGALWGPGLDLSPARGHDGVQKIRPAEGTAALFESGANGSMAAVVLDPGCGPATVMFDATGSLCFLVPADRPLVFYAGAAWRGAGVFPTAEKWFAYVMDFSERKRKAETR